MGLDRGWEGSPSSREDPSPRRWAVTAAPHPVLARASLRVCGGPFLAPLVALKGPGRKRGLPVSFPAGASLGKPAPRGARGFTKAQRQKASRPAPAP